LDGENVALDELGRSSFQSLQSIATESVKPPIVYYVFDLLCLNGRDLQGWPSRSAKARLKALLARASTEIRYSVSFVKHIDELLERARELQLEGLIGKRLGSRYEARKRSGAWIKLKLRLEQVFVIGGYTVGGRKHLGALLVGVYESNRP
jgi:bifunctional non-homologous end joining protein LigD